jgi:hypothetical protein
MISPAKTIVKLLLFETESTWENAGRLKIKKNKTK